MFARSIQQHRRWLVPLALCLTLAGLFIARTAFARILTNTINPVASLSDNGRQLAVTGPIQATAGERVVLRVTVTQRSTGAVAEGDVIFDGTGAPQQWAIQAVTMGKALFAPGPATATALAVTTSRDQATDAHQWLVNLTLVGP